MEQELLEIAKKRVAKKKGFYGHLAAYVAVGAFFFAMNMVSFEESERYWWFFPMMPWGIGVLIHYFTVFGLPFIDGNALSAEWEQKELEKEIRIARRERQLEDASDDNFQDDEDYLDLDQPLPKKEKRDNWDKEDLV